MKTIPLTQGKVALVDDEDFERVSQFKWYAAKDRRGWYAKSYLHGSGRKKQRTLWLHRVIMNAPDGCEVLHTDGNGLYNPKSNLRLGSRAQNSYSFQRKKAKATSSFRGVSKKRSSKKWEARLEKAGKTFYLGRFDNEEAAARAYDKKARELFGEWASPNFL